MVMPVLLDFTGLEHASWSNGVQLGGHADTLRDPAKRQAFLDRALLPFLQRYESDPRIYAIDIINEPEWVMAGVSPTISTSLDPDFVSVAEMQEFVRLCASYIDSHSAQRATVGSARRNRRGLTSAVAGRVARGSRITRAARR